MSNKSRNKNYRSQDSSDFWKAKEIALTAVNLECVKCVYVLRFATILYNTTGGGIQRVFLHMSLEESSIPLLDLAFFEYELTCTSDEQPFINGDYHINKDKQFW